MCRGNSWRARRSSLLIAMAALLMLPVGLQALQEEVKEKVRGELIEGFPPVPIYPGAIVEDSERIVRGGMTGFEADLISTDSVFKVYSHYIETLKRDGWAITFASANSPTAEEQGLGAAKDDVQIYIEIEEEDGKTEIEIEIPLQEAASD